MQQVAGEENVAEKLTQNVKSEVHEKHRADMGFSKETRREMVDEFLVLSLTCCQFCCPLLQRFFSFLPSRIGCSSSSRAKTLWKMRDAKERGDAYFDQTSEHKIVNREAVRQEL